MLHGGHQFLSTGAWHHWDWGGRRSISDSKEGRGASWQLHLKGMQCLWLEAGPAAGVCMKTGISLQCQLGLLWFSVAKAAEVLHLTSSTGGTCGWQDSLWWHARLGVGVGEYRQNASYPFDVLSLPFSVLLWITVALALHSRVLSKLFSPMDSWLYRCV